MSAPSFDVLIPARHGSTRLPGKPLRRLGGRALIVHVVERALASGAARVHVATDDERIARACEGTGAGVVMTASAHESGTARLAEACASLGLAPERIVVNVQGDEPLMPPALIRQVAALLQRHRDADMASLCHPIEAPAQLFDPNVVKVVLDGRGRALYFSRAPIPWDRAAFAQPRSAPVAAAHYRHIGIYAYRAGFLQRYVRLAPAPAERLEALEQLRALHHGASVMMAEALEPPGPGVDTEADLRRVRRLLGKTGGRGKPRSAGT